VIDGQLTESEFTRFKSNPDICVNPLFRFEPRISDNHPSITEEFSKGRITVESTQIAFQIKPIPNLKFSSDFSTEVIIVISAGDWKREGGYIAAEIILQIGIEELRRKDQPFVPKINFIFDAGLIDISFLGV